MRNETGVMEITIGSKKFETTYEKKVYESLDDVLAEASSDGDKGIAVVLKKMNWAEDWERKTSKRQEFIKEGEAAVADSFEKQVKLYMKNREKAGKPVTEAQARAKVQAMIDED